MKLKFFPLFKDEGELIAGWGEAQLIRYLDGKMELRGGTKEDRLAAHEWISLFGVSLSLNHGPQVARNAACLHASTTTCWG